MLNIIKQNYRNNNKLYKKIEMELKQLLGNEIAINHVGSTSIPNMYGKNIIDILIGANNEKEFNKYSDKIKQEYYINEKSRTNEYQFFASKEEETDSGDIHIHLVLLNTDRYNDFILLKKYLINNPKVAQQYSILKKELAKETKNKRKEYKALKCDFVSDLIKKAKKNN